MLILFVALALGWWRAARQQLDQVGFMAGEPQAGALLAVAAKFLGALLETAYYAIAWRAFGRRVPFVRMLCWILVLSSTDLFAWELGQRFRHLSGTGGAIVAAIAGIGFLPAGTLAPALQSAFGSLGVLTAVRVGYTAYAQTLATGVRLGRTVALTLATWLVTHAALAFGYAILQGRSRP